MSRVVLPGMAWGGMIKLKEPISTTNMEGK